MKILFSGGGTLGPVTPLLAMSEMVLETYPNTEFVWIGTKRGPEKDLIEQYNIPFFSIVSGKLRRYISLKNIIDLFKIKISFFQALKILWKQQPDVCITAGGFVSVPVHVAAWIMGIPTWVHQQDVQVGLANKLMSRFATLVSTALEASVRMFDKKKTIWLGNPVRQDILSGDIAEARKLFGLTKNLPVVFATGGGTGSMKVNQMVTQAVGHLEGACYIIHLSGLERSQNLVEPAARQFAEFYKPFRFFTSEMKHAYAIADVVVSRAGFGTISELAALKKPAIFIPKPGHQEQNSTFLQENQAAIVMDERFDNGTKLAHELKHLLSEKSEQKKLAESIHSVLPPAQSTKVLQLLKRVIES